MKRTNCRPLPPPRSEPQQFVPRLGIDMPAARKLAYRIVSQLIDAEVRVSKSHAKDVVFELLNIQYAMHRAVEAMTESPAAATEGEEQ